jgi:hypothetical protein
MKIFAIDPGNKESGYVVINRDNCRPLMFGKVPNEELRRIIRSEEFAVGDAAVIELVTSYGMPVGEEVFETCVWTGRFLECLTRRGVPSELMKRMEVKQNLCHDSRARDSNIRQALIDRFAPGAPNGGKGTVKSRGWFYGFKADIWAAYALAVTYADKLRSGKKFDLIGEDAS